MTDERRSWHRLELLYVWYAWTIAIAILIFGEALEYRWAWFLGHVVAVVPAWLLSRCSSLTLRYVAACVLTPTAFSTLGSILPDLVPEAVHWDVYRADLRIGGARVAEFFADPSWLFVEIVQLCYATFYFLPIGLVVALIARGLHRAAMETAELAVGGLLLSYLGYLVFPTLPPYRFLAYEKGLVGGPTFDTVHRLLYEYEALREDCMPSGHTMVTLIVLICAWRFDRRQLLWLVPIAGPLLVATLMLRYHWWIDVVAAIPFVILAFFLIARRADERRPSEQESRDSVPSADPR